MKSKLNLFLLAITIVTVFTACDEIDKLSEFDVNQEFVSTLDVVVPESAAKSTAVEVITWTTERTINLSENSEISDNIDLIERVAVNGLKYEIVNVSAGSASAAISNTKLDFGGIEIAIPNANLKDADVANTIFTIGDAAAKFSAIAAKLKNDKSITITASGTVSEQPVNFGVKLYLDTTVTIDIL